MNAGSFVSGAKLNHNRFIKKLNGHVTVEKHWNHVVAFNWVQGVYSFLEFLGFDELEADRIILEHLLPGYWIERIARKEVWPGQRFSNQFTDLIKQYENQSTEDWNAPYSRESESKILRLYSDPEHSKKFYANYHKEWLPVHTAIIQERNDHRSLISKYANLPLVFNDCV